jgi:hypothetical protein
MMIVIVYRPYDNHHISYQEMAPIAIIDMQAA